MQKRFNAGMIGLLVLVLCLIPVLTGQNTGLAQNVETIQVDSPLPEPNSMVVWYANTFKLSYEEAERRLNLQAEMDGVERKIAEGETLYAGSWMEHEPDFGLIVAFAAPNGEEIIKKYLDGIPWSTLVRVQERPYTIKELRAILEQVNLGAQKTGIPFSSGLSPHKPTSIIISTDKPEELRRQLETEDSLRPFIQIMEFVYQESPPVPAQLKYPYLLGGHRLSACNTGFVVTRNSDGRRFMSTSGHCSNTVDVVYNGTNSIFLGPVVFENDPVGNVGMYGDDIDLQAHDVTARSFDLTNVIRTGAATTARVVSVEFEATTLYDTVCKYGKITNETCGVVTQINYSPGGDWGGSDDYVFVSILINDIGCPGDSGSPVYKYVAGGVSALGLLSGVENDLCNGTSNWFIYTPIDEINRAGFSILTTHYQQRYLQNVFWTETNCRQYIQPYDDNGNPFGAQTDSACNTTAAPGTNSETIQTYTGYVMGNFWREGMWRNNRGYTRNVPLNSNGTINWGAAPAWSFCCGPQDAPRSQDGYIIGNHFYQNVWWTETDCKEYKRDIDNNGNPTGVTTIQTCRTSLPVGSSLTIQSYTAYPVGGNLREGMWRNGIGYVRTVPLNATNTDVDWNNAPTWSQCCTNNAPPRAQGGYVLSYP